MKKRNIVVAICALMLAGSALLPGASSAFSEAGLQAAYGNPVLVVTMDNGAEKRYYQVPVINGATIYRVFEVSGSQAADKGLALLPSANDVKSVAASSKTDKNS
jgi:hypothetical protein